VTGERGKGWGKGGGEKNCGSGKGGCIRRGEEKGTESIRSRRIRGDMATRTQKNRLGSKKITGVRFVKFKKEKEGRKKKSKRKKEGWGLGKGSIQNRGGWISSNFLYS